VHDCKTNSLEALQFSNIKLFIIAGLKLEKLKGKIQYADVSFSYPSRPTVCLHSFLYFMFTSTVNELVLLILTFNIQEKFKKM